MIPKLGTTLKTNLISCWEFEETSGTVVYDSHGSYNLNNNTSISINQTGKLGKCYLFNGTDQWLSLDSIFRFSSPGFAVSLWIKANSWSNKTYPGLIGGRNFGTDSSYGGYAIGYFPTAGIYRGLWFDIYSSSIRKAAMYAFSPSTEVWYHVVGNAKSDKIEIWVNGQRHDYVNDVLTAPFSINYTNAGSGALRLGASTQPIGSWNPFSGYIDQTAIWNRALTSTEIALLYNSGNGLTYSNW